MIDREALVKALRNVAEAVGSVKELRRQCSPSGELEGLTPREKTIIASIGDILHNGGTQITKIQGRVCVFYDVSLAQMLGDRKFAHVAFPRQVAMYLCRILTDNSWKEIGENFGGRDHGTVLHAFKVVIKKMEDDEKVRWDVESLKRKLRAGSMVLEEEAIMDGACI